MEFLAHQIKWNLFPQPIDNQDYDFRTEWEV